MNEQVCMNVFYKNYITTVMFTQNEAQNTEMLNANRVSEFGGLAKLVV